MPKIRFNDTTVAALRAGEYWDVLLPAFGIRVGKRRRTFIVNHDNRRKKLGHYPALSLKAARQKAADLLDGKQIEKAEITTEVLDVYLRTIDVRPSTRAEYRRILTSLIPKKNIREVTSRDITAITDDMLETPSAARHAHVAMKVFFNWCAKRDYVEISPMHKLDAPTKHQARDRVLLDDEIKAIWLATSRDGVFNRIVQLCILTGMRRGEAAQLKPSWIQEHRLVIPQEAAKNNREHSLPLTAKTEDLAAALAAALNGAKYSAWSKNKAKLDKRCGVTAWTIHDLRRTFATNCAKLGIRPETIERLLNHSTTHSSIHSVYNRHAYLEEMRIALDKHEAWLLQVVADAAKQAATI